MKRLLLLALLVSSAAHAQEPFQMARPAGTPQISGTPGVSTKAAVDKYGNQQVVMVAPGGTGASPVKAEDSVAANGDPLIIGGSVRRDTASTLSDANGDYQYGVATSTGAQDISIDRTFQRSDANSILKAEDAVAANLDALVSVGGVVNETTADKAVDGDYVQIAQTRVGTVLTSNIYDGNLTSTRRVEKREDEAAASGDALVGVAGIVDNGVTAGKAASGDYTGFAVSDAGTTVSALVLDPSITFTKQAVKAEDSAAANGDAGVAVFSRTNSALAASAATNNDFVNIQSDELGRTITTLAPAGEMWQACSAEATGTSSTNIKVGVASNRTYVTQISCSNNSAVPSRVSFSWAGVTNFASGSIPALANGGTFTTTFPVPARSTTTNEDLRFIMTTTATATICCATGYISVN